MPAHNPSYSGGWDQEEAEPKCPGYSDLWLRHCTPAWETEKKKLFDLFHLINGLKVKLLEVHSVEGKHYHYCEC